MHYILLDQRTYIPFKNVRGGILGKKVGNRFHCSTIFPRLRENTQTDMFETSQPWENQTSPCRLWLQGYKLVGRVQFMLLVIQKGG